MLLKLRLVQRTLFVSLLQRKVGRVWGKGEEQMCFLLAVDVDRGLMLLAGFSSTLSFAKNDEFSALMLFSARDRRTTQAHQVVQLPQTHPENVA